MTLRSYGLGPPMLVLAIFLSIRFLPPALINQPHRDYWLVPHRREGLYRFVFRMGLCFATLEVLFMLGVHLMMVTGKRTISRKLSGNIWILGACMACTGIRIFFLNRTPSAPQVPQSEPDRHSSTAP